MKWLLPLLWLAAAAVCAAVAVLTAQPVLDGLPVSAAVAHETVVAEQMPSLAAQSVTPELPVAPEAAAPDSAARPQAAKHTEWVAIIGFTAVVRAGPSARAPVVTAYPVGHAFRVIERRGDFARVQDLSSGQLGWVSAASIGAFLPGYREREAPLAQLVAASAQTAAAPQGAAKLAAAQVSHTAVAAPARPKAVTVALAEPLDHPALMHASLKPQRVAENEAHDGMTALVERAFSGY
jgi:hypothetical protein